MRGGEPRLSNKESVMFDSQLTVVGNLVADPRLAETPDGSSVASFRIASTRRWFDRASGEWRDGDTLYANVTCWRGLAENVVASLKKGQSAVVIGRLSVRPYETKDGEKRQSVDIDAQVVGSDLSRAISLVKRAERSGASGSGSAGVDSPASSGSGFGEVVGATDEWRSIGVSAEAPAVDDGDGGGDDSGDDFTDALAHGTVIDIDTAGLDGASSAGELVGAGVGAGSGAGAGEAAGEVGDAGVGGRRKARFGIG
jgi:single-strand DNA-binding protein